MGSWKVKQAVQMMPHHQGDDLIWHATVSVPDNFRCEYNYCLVDDKRNLLKWESGKRRTFVLPDGLPDGASVDVYDLWRVDCKVRKDEFPIKYKYFVKDKTLKVIPEVGSDRELSWDSIVRKPATMIFVSDGSFREAPWRGAGVALPVFSLRSKDDIGVGEFLDLKLLVDLSVKSGFHLVQLLPVNDTSVHGMWWDSYPYSSLSVFALHPLYLRVQALSKTLPEEIKQEIEKARKQLNLKDVDYDATMATKLSIAKKIFYLQKDEVLSSSAFQKFFQENEAWLKPYAAFCFLRDLFETSDHSQWGRFSEFSKIKVHS